MPDVLRVAAIQIGNPIIILIFVKADDAACHVRDQLCQKTTPLRSWLGTEPRAPASGFAGHPYGAVCSARTFGSINSRCATF